MCFVKEPTEFEESALNCDLSRRPGITNAGFVLNTSLSITFLTNNDIFFMIGYHHCVRSVFSIRAGGRRNSPAISRQLADYFENK